MKSAKTIEKLVSKRIHVTLPDSIFAALERWADDQGRPVANLAAFIIEKSIERAIEEGKVPPVRKKRPIELNV